MLLFTVGSLCHFIALAIAANTLSTECVLDPYRNHNQLSPIFLNSGGGFFIPNKWDGQINLHQSQSFNIACPGPKNELKCMEKVQFAHATCVCANVLNIHQQNYNFTSLECTKAVRGEIEKTTISCGRSEFARILRIGYRLSPNPFLPLIEVCYDETNGTTLYTEHKLYGHQLKYASKGIGGGGISFSTSGLGETIAAAVVFKRAFQKSHFTQILHAGHYITTASYLERGHLSPTADFIFTPWQRTTYYYINVQPQWKVINNGNWKNLEINIRRQAQKLQDTFHIVTGTYEILKLPDKNGKLRAIYMQPHEKLPVPKYMWKIVYSMQSNNGIAFVLLNNPFASQRNHQHAPQEFCHDICDRTNWMGPNWRNTTRGYIWCCQVEDFLAIVPSVPYFRVDGILTGSGL